MYVIFFNKTQKDYLQKDTKTEQAAQTVALSAENQDQCELVQHCLKLSLHFQEFTKSIKVRQISPVTRLQQKPWSCNDWFIKETFLKNRTPIVNLNGSLQLCRKRLTVRTRLKLANFAPRKVIYGSEINLSQTSN